MMRAGLIGCGRIGCEFDSDAHRIGIYTHAAAWRAATGVELYAVADPDPAKLANCGERYAIPPRRRYADPAVMLAEAELELVSIAAPDPWHVALTEQALRTPSVRGVLLEKPLALTVAEGARLVALAADRRIALALNYSRRFCPAHERVRAALAAGSLGRIQQLSGYYGKGIRHNGSHWLDLLCHLLGPIAKLQAWPSGAAAFEDDPSPDLRIDTEAGVNATLLATDHQAYSLFEMDIVAERGRICISNSGHLIAWYGIAASPYYAGYQLPELQDLDEEGMQNLLLAAVEDLRDAVLAGRPPRCTGQDGLAALRAAEAAVHSLASGQPEWVR